MTNAVDVENPFNITRTEFFNSNFEQIAEFFEEPPFYNDLVQRGNFIIAGSRGTGKTMILKSLYWPVFINSLKKKKVDISKYTWDFIGIYVPCDNLDLQRYFNELYVGYFDKNDPNKAYIVWKRYLSNYLAIYIVKQLLETILRDGAKVGLDLFNTNSLNKKILESFDSSHLVQEEWPETLSELPNFLDREKKIFSNFVMDSIQGSAKSFNRPIVDLSFISNVCNLLIGYFKQFASCRFYVLLDDFFPPFVTFKQQAVLLDLIRQREGPLSFKITTIPEGMTYVTESNYDMRPEQLDYHQEFLEFSEVGRKSTYWNLVKEITNKRLSKYHCDYKSLFEDPKLIASKVFGSKKRSEKLSETILNSDIKVSGGNFVEKKINEKTKEKELKQGSKDFLMLLSGGAMKGHYRPIYAGFDMIVEMSSGVIGTYLALVREMVNQSLKEAGLKKFSADKLPIASSIQDDIVRSRSELFLGSILGLEYGQSLYKLVTLMARESRHRLLTNPTANEYIQFKIKNYEDLLKGDKQAHRKLIVAFRNNILHSPDCTKTDRQKNVILRTLIINRLLTPALRIPYRDRWAVDKQASEIESILNSDATIPQPISVEPPISLKPQPFPKPFHQRKLSLLTTPQKESVLTPIIQTTSCSIFSRHYCMKTKELLANEEGAFLALPFTEDWHKVAAELIKNKIGKRNVVTSLDISPNGDFTCKICENIAKRDYGIYEITVLNENVIFEMGLSIGMGKHTFAIWNKEVWDNTYGNPESLIMFLINGFETFPYLVSEDDGINDLFIRINNSLKKIPWNKEDIKKINDKEKIFLCLPNSVYYEKNMRKDALHALKEIGIDEDSVIKLPKDFKAGLNLTNTFRAILESKLCIIDSTQMYKYSNTPEQHAHYVWRMFSLGVAAGLRKPLIHLFNSNYAQVVASDIRGKCTFVYKDTELHDKLLEALKEVVAKDRQN